MSTKASDHRNWKYFIKTVFTPLTVLWVTAVVFGFILPIVTQNLIASWVGDLSTASYIKNNVVITPTVDSFYNAVALLTATVVTYIIVVCHQAYFVYKIGKYFALWTLIVTIIGPIIVWLIVPALLY